MSTMTLVIPGILLLISPSMAYFSFQDQLPNGNNVPHPCKVNYRWPGVGHENPNGGGSNNAFGLAFKAAGYQWTQTLCRQDSDGDGKTNGEELGDPACTWSPGREMTPSRTDDITHPGVCEPLDSPLCQGKTDFVDCNLATFEDCDRIKEPGVKNLTVRFSSTPVPASETNYFCMTYDLPSDQDYHIIANEPLIVNRNVMHHILLFGCTDGSTINFDQPGSCGMAAEDGGCSDIIAAWTVGATGDCMKSNIGVRIGQTSYKRALMQVHWNNPKQVEDYVDSSGLILYYQRASPEVLDLAMLMVGQRILDIPPGQARVEQVGVCPSSCTSMLFTKPAYITYGLNHMHYLGRSQKVELFRNGKKVKDIMMDENYSYDSPTRHYHDPPLQILPGDEIRTTCVFNSLSSSRHVYFGDGTQDEMCLGFISLYPKDAIPNTKCLAFGPISSCELRQGTPKLGCNWAQFVRNDLTMNEYSEELRQNCNLDGFCRPECREVHNRLAEHPCMNEPMLDFVTFMMGRSHEGLKFLGRFHSCGGHSKDDHSGQCTRDKCDC